MAHHSRYHPLGKIDRTMIRSLILLSFLTIPAMAQSYKCLPGDIRLDTVAKTDRVATRAGQEKIEKTTIVQTLKKLKASCSGAKLVDNKRREIRFYRLQGCWGNPPQDYLEIMDRQRRELIDLKKKFTVVEITCNPSGLDIP